MTERITPAEIERIAVDLGDEHRDVLVYDPDLANRMCQWEKTLLQLAEQTESDRLTLSSVNSSWRDRLAEAEAERDDLAASVELFAKCLARAGRMWNDAHPDRPLVWPDGAANIVWLLEQNDALAAKVAEYEERIRGRVLVPVRAYDHIPSRSVLAYIDMYFGFDAPKREGKGETVEEATDRLQAIIDGEDAP